MSKRLNIQPRIFDIIELMPKFIVLWLAAIALATFSQAKAEPSLFKKEERYRPDSEISDSGRFGNVENGAINGVSYHVYLNDGSGVFSATRGDDASKLQGNWEVDCRKDLMDDSKYCGMKVGTLWIVYNVRPRKEFELIIGVDNFPGTKAGIRVDGGKAIYNTTRDNGHFSAAQSRTIVGLLRKGKHVVTSFEQWPSGGGIDTDFDLYGFNECLEYIMWAGERMK